MGLLGDTKRLVDSYSGHVFGTWEGAGLLNGVRYDSQTFEREREDETAIIGLSPDCRVFICGAEVTKDIDNVEVTNSLNGNKCTITLQNPRGRYEISKSDLMKKWREDKDILAAYSYSIFDRKDPLSWDNLAEKLAKPLMGDSVYQIMDMAKKSKEFAKNIISYTMGMGWGGRGSTRMLFEVKHFSGINLRSGDCVFDYRDPVYVFFRGRFSPYWYFGFSGIIDNYSDEDVFGTGSKITLNCLDTSGIWQRTKMLQKGAFYTMSNLENRIQNTSTTSKTSPYKDITTNYNFSTALKILATSVDKGTNTFNCHPCRPGREGENGLYDLTNPVWYEMLKETVHINAQIDRGYMTTDDTILYSAVNRFLKDSSGKIDTSFINYVGFKGGPNNYPFSPSTSLYLQINEMEFPEGGFRGYNFNKYFDLSVRYWEVEHDILLKIGMTTGGVKTGWVDNKAYGIAGIHPAMKYSFVDNFNILEGIWTACYQKGYNPLSGQVNVDYLITSPLDKIRETIAGSPTEAGNSSTVEGSNGEGTSLNLFRPRLFILLPQKFANRMRKMAGGFGQLGKVFEAEGVPLYQYFKDKLKAVEYNMYCSPAGDIFIEPELYDMHPMEFYDKIEGRSIDYKEEYIQFRGRVSSTSTANGSKNVNVDATAYFFNPKANHPFFIMEKDRYRNTHVFNPSGITSAVEVIGDPTSVGGAISDGLKVSEVSRIMTLIGKGSGAKMSDKSPFQEGLYIADGFEDFISQLSTDTKWHETLAKIEEDRNYYRKLIFIELMSSAYDLKVGDMVKNYISNIENVYKECNWEPDVYNVFKKIKTDVLGESFVTANNDELVKRVLKDQFYSIVGLYRTSEDPLVEAKNKKVTDIVKSPTVRVDFKAGDSNRSSEVKMDPMNLMDAIREKVGDIGSKDDEMKKRIAEYDNLGFFDGIGNQNDTIFSVSKAVVNDLMRLYEVTAITNISKIKDFYTKMKKTEDSIVKPVNLKASTLADLKQMALNGIYNPKMDIVRRYGYKKIDPIKNPFIPAGKEAVNYSKSVFNRLLGQAYKIDATVIGRPEFMLNRPYFFERKDAIGLMESFTVSYRYGAEFQSHINLTYIRKNALAYSYAIGDGLDSVVSFPTNDAYFDFQGSLYLRTNAIIKKAAAMAAKGITALGANSGNSSNAAIASVAGGGVQDFITNYIQPVGGIFVAHEDLGHMDFDERGMDKSYTQPITLYGPGNNALFPKYAIKMLQDISQTITDKRKELNDLKNQKATAQKEVETKEKAKNTQEDLLKSDTGTTEEDIFLKQKDIMLARKAIRDWDTAKKKVADWDAKIAEVKKILYGEGYKKGQTVNEHWNPDPEAPNNVGKSTFDSDIKNLYKLVKGIPFSSGLLVAIPQGFKEGLYTQLLITHIDATTGSKDLRDYTVLVTPEQNKDIGGDYYIKFIAGV